MAKSKSSKRTPQEIASEALALADALASKSESAHQRTRDALAEGWERYVQRELAYIESCKAKMEEAASKRDALPPEKEGGYEWINLDGEVRYQRQEIASALERIEGKPSDIAQEQPEQPPRRAVSSSKAFTARELAVLRALAKHAGRRLTVYDLETCDGVPNRRSLSGILAALNRRGLVDYDARRRQGAAITSDGERALSHIETARKAAP